MAGVSLQAQIKRAPLNRSGPQIPLVSKDTAAGQRRGCRSAGYSKLEGRMKRVSGRQIPQFPIQNSPIGRAMQGGASGAKWSQELQQTAQNGPRAHSMQPQRCRDHSSIEETGRQELLKIKWALQLKNACSPLSGCLAWATAWATAWQESLGPASGERVNNKSTPFLNLHSSAAWSSATPPPPPPPPLASSCSSHSLDGQPWPRWGPSPMATLTDKTYLPPLDECLGGRKTILYVQLNTSRLCKSG